MRVLFRRMIICIFLFTIVITRWHYTKNTNAEVVAIIRSVKEEINIRLYFLLRIIARIWKINDSALCFVENRLTLFELILTTLKRFILQTGRGKTPCTFLTTQKPYQNPLK